mmetsp:Transcript_3062/g.8651  ORF Transcript_3062/g.8651 Transcript_3062/m.8651 type:complete len:507 (-) Transcript_3062:312-1832(-)
MPPPHSSGAAAPKARRLARSILSTTTRTATELNQHFRELTELLHSTHPPLFVPRVPSVTCSGQRRQQQLLLLQKIQSRADKITIVYHNPEQQPDEGREEPNNTAANRTYGTTPGETILTLLDIVYPDDDDVGGSSRQRRPTGSFMDAGSGQGIPALAAALSGKFDLARGIEFEPAWHESALAVQQAYYDDREETPPPPPCRLEYDCADMTDTKSFQGASCVFSNCVLFDSALSHGLSARLEEDLGGQANQQGDEDIFVVTMSKRMALPSFDLVDVLSLNANGGLFTFYVNRLSRPWADSKSSSSHFHATSDSEAMRALRSEANEFDELVELALRRSDARVGMGFLIALAASEPSIRSLGSNVRLLTRLTESLDMSADLHIKALASMLLRAMSDHPTGRRSINRNEELVGRIVALVANSEEHSAIRTNLLDVVGNLLHDSSLESVFRPDTGHGLETTLEEIVKTSGDHSSLIEAAEEVIAMRRWWEGHQRSVSQIGGFDSPNSQRLS